MAILLGLVMVPTSLWAEPPAASKSNTPTKDPASSSKVTAEDYQAEIPDPLPPGMAAMTETDIHWRMEYDLKTSGKETHAVLKSIRAQAVILKEKSWSTDKNSDRLLDHGQGHLDITRAFAMEWELKMREAIGKGKAEQGMGPNVEVAVQRLQKRIQDRLQAEQYLLLERHRDYDRETDHGRSNGMLRKHRDSQAKRLKELAELLGGLPTGS